MTPAKDHETVVREQFGARAADYVASAVHAAGEDLELIETLAKSRPGGRALDLGCGGGHLTYRLAAHAREVVALDLSEDMLRAVGEQAVRRGLKNVVTRRGAAQAIPLADAAFDVVASRFSAHHWPNLVACLREARRVLAPGGLAIFVDTAAPSLTVADTYLQAMELLRDPSHVRDYTVDEWLASLRAAGFEPGKVTPRRVRLDFAPWVARMATPEEQIQAVRCLQGHMPEEVATYFEVQPDGTFTVDAVTIEATPV